MASISNGGGGGGATTFTGLTDTPSSYSGMAAKAVSVNTAGTGLEFKDFPQSGGFSADNLTHLSRKLTDQTLVAWGEPYGGEQTNRISWDTEESDGLGAWSSGDPTKITIPTSGTYAIMVHLPVIMNSWTRAAILKNTDAWSGEGFLSQVAHADAYGSSNVPKVHTIYIPAVSLVKDDILYVAVIGTNGGSTTVASEPCKLWIQKLEPATGTPVAPSGWSADNLTLLKNDPGSTQSLVAWESPYDATKTNLISWSAQDADGLGIWSSGAAVTIATSGWYSIQVHLPVAINSWSQVALLKNTDNFSATGSNLLDLSNVNPNGSTMVQVHHLNIPAVQLSANDVLRVALICGASGATSSATTGRIWIQRLA